MPKNLIRNSQKRAKEAKSWMKVPSRKMTRLEHARQNIFKSLTIPVNKNSTEIIMMNKRATFEKFDRKTSDKIKDFVTLGTSFHSIRHLRSR